MDAESRTKNGDCCKEVAEISELTFAPTAREDTFKLFMALATLMNWDLRQLDVRSAFTNAMLIERVYVYSNSSLQIAESPVWTEAISTKLELGLLKETD